MLLEGISHHQVALNVAEGYCPNGLRCGGNHQVALNVALRDTAQAFSGVGPGSLITVQAAASDAYGVPMSKDFCAFCSGGSEVCSILEFREPAAKMWLIPSYSVPGTPKFCLADWPGLQGDFRGYTGGLFGIACVFVGLVALGRHMSYWQHNKHA